MKEHHCVLCIFGATGDLANRKLLPALYYLEQESKLSDSFRVVCVARKEKIHEDFREDAAKSIRSFSRMKVDDKNLQKLLSKIYYHKLEFSSFEDYEKLKSGIEQLSGQDCSECERIFYLAVPPEFFKIIAQNLKKSGLASRQQKSKPYNRVMFEKPFGHDLKSSSELNHEITQVFDENQIYRIDHYMAKELVQNLLVLRFANSIFEPLWNKNYIDHIQITVAESLGVEGRGDYYEKSGAMRDVMQNHMMQLLTLVAMEEPENLLSENIKKEKIRVLKSVEKFMRKTRHCISVRGQYDSGEINEKPVAAYVGEQDVAKDSRTETYMALKVEINNRMWHGVPFYLRTGKRLKDRATEIAIIYKNIPFTLFSGQALERNMMKIRVQPYEGITLQFNAKVPGNKVIIDNVNMDFCHECKFGPNSPEAYEILLFDAMKGDSTLFTSWPEVENSWRIFDLLSKKTKNEKLYRYNSGSWGPEAADLLIKNDLREWVAPKKPDYAEILDRQS
ncbi:MAG TPA: glucose-6-phosphate dehydrogenase [Candidatus Nanoarchaeia archaeon]|nr:glucose-6-phosphate dehydrogenase [Candidatus Nanoarchaeia archaeon]